MTVLVAAVDGESLSAASRALGMPLASVSRKVSELEAHLRTRLLIRTSRKLQLTEAGRGYVAACRRVLDELDEAERAATGEYRAPRGDLTITAPVGFGRLHVEPVALAFLRAYPDINVRLVLADHVVDLVEHRVDLAVRIGRLPDSSLVAARLGEISWITCASPNYLKARGTPLAPHDLAAHDCIAFEGAYSSPIWRFCKGRDGTAVSIRPRFAVNTAAAVIDAAMEAHGIARVLSYQAEGAILQGRLVRVLQAFEPDPMPVHLVYTGRPLLPLKLRAFVDFASPPLKASLARLAGHPARDDAVSPLEVRS